MTKKIERLRIHVSDWFDPDGATLESITKAFKQFAENNNCDISTVKIDIDVDWSGTSTSLIGYRLENDEEYERRVAALKMVEENKRKANVKAAKTRAKKLNKDERRELFEELKREFE